MAALATVRVYNESLAITLSYGFKYQRGYDLQDFWKLLIPTMILSESLKIGYRCYILGELDHQPLRNFAIGIAFA